MSLKVQDQPSDYVLLSIISSYSLKMYGCTSFFSCLTYTVVYTKHTLATTQWFGCALELVRSVRELLTTRWYEIVFVFDCDGGCMKEVATLSADPASLRSPFYFSFAAV